MATAVPSTTNNACVMNSYVITSAICRQRNQCRATRALLLAMLPALFLHLLIVLLMSEPIERHDVPHPHRVSLLEVELVSAAHASEVDKPVTSPQPVRPVPPTPSAVKASEPLVQQAPPVHRPVVQKKHRKPVQHPRKKQTVTKKPVAAPVITQPALPPTPDKQQNGPVNIAPRTEPARPLVPAARLQSLRQHYIDRIMQIIKAHKTYPYSARRRHMEDDIRVSFTVTADGYARDIRIHGQHSLLERSTHDAITSSQPFPAIPAALGATSRISFIMQYRLNR